MSDLKETYQDDVLAESMNGERKYLLTFQDGSAQEVTIKDISEYSQQGDDFGAAQVNAIAKAVNGKFELTDLVDPMMATKEGFAADALATKKALDEQNKKMPFAFGIDGDGNYGYYGADDSLIPFKRSSFKELGIIVSTSTNNKWSCLLDSSGHVVASKTGEYLYIYHTGDNVVMKVLQDCTGFWYKNGTLTTCDFTTGQTFQYNVQYTGWIIVAVL